VRVLFVVIQHWVERRTPEIEPQPAVEPAQ
jgi:hypothetical protein